MFLQGFVKGNSVELNLRLEFKIDSQLVIEKLVLILVKFGLVVGILEMEE